MVGGLEDKPDLIVLDPPRDGVHPKALSQIIDFGVNRMVLRLLQAHQPAEGPDHPAGAGISGGAGVLRGHVPFTGNVETVVLLGRKFEKSREHVYLDYEPSAEIDLPGGATYSEIKQWIQAEYDLKVSSLYVAQVKQKHGIVERECYNKPKSENAKQPKCPPEKEAAIEAALKHFKMI